MALDGYSIETASASSLPEFREVALKKTAVSPLVITVGSSENIWISCEIVVRGDLSQTITVPVNLHREKVIQENLVANRGVVLADTSNTHEG